jgi:hypothetical protein
MRAREKDLRSSGPSLAPRIAEAVQETPTSRAPDAALRNSVITDCQPIGLPLGQRNPDSKPCRDHDIAQFGSS